MFMKIDFKGLQFEVNFNNNRKTAKRKPHIFSQNFKPQLTKKRMKEKKHYIYLYILINTTIYLLVHKMWHY